MRLPRIKNSRDTKRSSSYAPNVRRPSSGATLGRRGLFGIALSILLPPIGIIYIWRNLIFIKRGRFLMTVIAGIEIVILIVLLGLVPKDSPTRIMPEPVSPQAATAAPEDTAQNSLSNINEILGNSSQDEIVVDTPIVEGEGIILPTDSPLE